MIINNLFNQNVKFESTIDRTIEILISQELLKDNEIKIDFIFKNLISPHEALESPDSRKLGILVKNMRFISI